jgi:hypothetical protein
MKKMLSVSAFLAIVVGLILVIGGCWAIRFTYTNVINENITTPSDASIPNMPVRGPFTLKSQADIIREHTLNSTNGKTFAEMPRQTPKLSDNGEPVLNVEGKPVMIANTARDIWITATTLITALNLGIISYVFSGLILLFGLISIWTGITFCVLSRKY